MMRMIKSLILPLAILCLSIFALKSNGQQRSTDSTNVDTQPDSIWTMVYYNSDFHNPQCITSIDTGLLSFHRYDPAFKGNYPFATTGNLGLPLKTLLPQVEENNPFSVGLDRFGPYVFRLDNMPYYHTNIPYSEVKYVMGPNEENFVDFTLGNQLSQGLYFGTDLRFESSEGAFLNQRSANNHFRLVVDANSRNNAYHITVNYIRNRFKYQENGGFINDFFYEDTTRLNRRLLSMSIVNGQNFITSNLFTISQTLGSPDSTLKKGKAVLDLSYNTAFRQYSDNGAYGDYYVNYYLDSLSTLDSTSNRQLNAFLGWHNLSDSLKFNYKIGWQTIYNQYFTGDSMNVTGAMKYNHAYMGPRLYLSYASRKFAASIHAHYLMQVASSSYDFNENSFFLRARVSYATNNKYRIFAELRSCLSEEDILFHRSYSNHFIWKNDLKQEHNTQLIAGIDLKGFQFEFSQSLLSNHVYFDTLLQPIQATLPISITRVSLHKLFTYKSFGSDVFVAAQFVDKDSLYRLPQLLARANVYFSFKLFKGILRVFPGLEASYHSAYYADGYNPSNMVFYVQNEKRIDNQLYVDAFVNFKVKRARIFLIYKNLNMLLGNYNYFQVLHYPQQDAGLKIGVSWRFYD
jgi:hypothetical protein